MQFSNPATGIHWFIGSGSTLRLGVFNQNNNYMYYESSDDILTMKTWEYVGITYDYQAGKIYSPRVFSWAYLMHFLPWPT